MTNSPDNVLKAYEKGLGAQNFDAVADLIAPDAVFWFTDGTHQGREALRRAFELTWATLKDETYWLDELNWIAKGDEAAACTYRFNWKARVDGTLAEGSGRGTTVLQKREGRWLIVHEHLSAHPASQPD